MPKGKKPSIKQRIFANEYIKTKGNGTQSALKAYDVVDPNVANSIAVENLQKPLIKKLIEDRMDELGLGNDYLINKHKELLELKRDKVVFNHETGTFETLETDKADPVALSKGLDMAYKLKGAYKDRLTGGNTTNIQVNILNKEDRHKRIQELEAQLLNNDTQ